MAELTKTHQAAQRPCPRRGDSPPDAEPSGRTRDSEIARLMGISVPLSVVLADRLMSIESIMSIGVGTIVEFDVPSDAELTLYVANRPIGRGAPVKVGENFGIRLSRIGTLRDRIDALASSSARKP